MNNGVKKMKFKLVLYFYSCGFDCRTELFTFDFIVFQLFLLLSNIAGMLLESTGEFLDAGLQKSGNEFWESADDSTASDEIR